MDKPLTMSHGFERYEVETSKEIERLLIFINEVFHSTFHFIPIQSLLDTSSNNVVSVFPESSSDINYQVAPLFRKFLRGRKRRGSINIDGKVIIYEIFLFKERKKREGALFFALLEEGNKSEYNNTSYVVSFLKFLTYIYDLLLRKNRDVQAIRETIEKMERSPLKKDGDLIAKERDKEDLILRVTHELKTPLNSVLGYSEMLLSGMYGPINDRQANAIQGIMEMGYQLVDMITQIIDYSRIERGESLLRIQRFSVNDVIEENIKIARGLIKGKNIELKVRIEPGSIKIRSDRNKISHIVLNLLSNAIKFTPEGNVTVKVSRLKDWGIRISVMDTGIGIKEEFLKDLFKPFHTGSQGWIDTLTGTGLGLSIVKRYTELIGGRIKVKSRYGSGSTFTLEIPDMKE